MTRDPGKTRILIVDDTPKNIQVLGTMLKQQDYQINVAQDGIQALNMVDKIRPDLILLDVMMPNLDGFETCKRLKASPKSREIPIIFLTAKTETQDVVKGFELGAVDYVSKPFNSAELLARVHTHVQLQREINERKARELILTEELQQARETQKVLLPQQLPEIPGIRIATKFIPMAEVGGDFYNIFPVDEDHFGLMVADVTGHGISAALISFMVSGAFSTASQGQLSPKQVLSETNLMLHGKLPSTKFSTMFYCIFDVLKKSLVFSSASHPNPLLIRAQSKEILALKSRGMFVGIFSNEIACFEEQTLSLDPGDKLLIFTDAMVEVVDKHNEILGEEGLSLFLSQHRELSINELVEALYSFGLSYAEEDCYRDDCTIVGVEFLQTEG
ncbi:SpoIIE family protein phosphatase [Deltaproteobacteria bacterium TL4]